MRIAMLGAAVTTTLATALWFSMPSAHTNQPPATDISPAARETSSEPVTPVITPVAAVAAPAAPVVDERVVKRGDTLMKLLVNSGISRAEAHEAITALAKVYDPRDIRPGLQITVTRDAPETEKQAEPSLKQIDLAVDPTRRVAVERDDAGTFHAEAIDTPLTAQATRTSGTIHSSLYEAGTRADLPANTLAEMIRIFSYDVDFQRDVQPGDSFDLMYDEMQDKHGNTLAEGNILIAEMVLSGKKIRLYRHKAPDGTVDYYDAKGRSTRKALIMTPIDGARISSGFGMRKHPILGYSRMHRGIDFAAPRGTPIYAAGNGVIEVAGRYGGYGNYIRIRHNGTYKTGYGHMYHFAKGIHVGERVHQGEVIGYVGSTGMSTGPHLHYEVIRNNKKVNPKKLNLPSGRILAGKELKQFMAERNAMETTYASLPAETQFVDADAADNLQPAAGDD